MTDQVQPDSSGAESAKKFISRDGPPPRAGTRDPTAINSSYIARDCASCEDHGPITSETRGAGNLEDGGPRSRYAQLSEAVLDRRDDDAAQRSGSVCLGIGLAWNCTREWIPPVTTNDGTIDAYCALFVCVSIRSMPR